MLTVLAFAFMYYGHRLITIVQQNFANSGQASPTTGTAIKYAMRKMNVMTYFLGPVILTTALVTIIMAVLHQTIFENPVASILFAIMFHFVVQVSLTVITGSLFVMEIASLLNDHSEQAKNDNAPNSIPVPNEGRNPFTGTDSPEPVPQFEMEPT